MSSTFIDILTFKLVDSEVLSGAFVFVITMTYFGTLVRNIFPAVVSRLLVVWLFITF